jgi:hypothetical protein
MMGVTLRFASHIAVLLFSSLAGVQYVTKTECTIIATPRSILRDRLHQDSLYYGSMMRLLFLL